MVVFFYCDRINGRFSSLIFCVSTSIFRASTSLSDRVTDFTSDGNTNLSFCFSVLRKINRTDTERSRSAVVFPKRSRIYQKNYASQSGSFSQSTGKPIARLSTVGYSANNDLSFCVNLLFGETVERKYLIMQIRK